MVEGKCLWGECAKSSGRLAIYFIGTAWKFISRDSVLPDRPPSSAFGNVPVETDASLSHIPAYSQDMTIKGNGFVPSARVQELRKKLNNFMEKHVYQLEKQFIRHAQSDKRWTIHPSEGTQP